MDRNNSFKQEKDNNITSGEFQLKPLPHRCTLLAMLVYRGTKLAGDSIESSCGRGTAWNN